MAASTSENGAVSAIVASLSPYEWRKFTATSLARRVVGAYDRHTLADVLATVPGAVIGPWEERSAPVAGTDPRVAALVAILDGHHWRELRLPTLCAFLLEALQDIM